jgi:hypothetical protein
MKGEMEGIETMAIEGHRQPIVRALSTGEVTMVFRDHLHHLTVRGATERGYIGNGELRIVD